MVKQKKKINMGKCRYYHLYLSPDISAQPTTLDAMLTPTGESQVQIENMLFASGRLLQSLDNLQMEERSQLSRRGEKTCLFKKRSTCKNSRKFVCLTCTRTVGHRPSWKARRKTGVLITIRCKHIISLSPRKREGKAQIHSLLQLDPGERAYGSGLHEDPCLVLDRWSS